MEEIVAVDFGMKNLKVAYFTGKEPSLIKLDNEQGEDLTPNIVYYEEDMEDGKLKKYFGKSKKAEDAKRMQSEDYIQGIKRKLQKSGWKKNLCKGKYQKCTEEIIGDIFENIKKAAIAEIRKDTIEIIMTVPVIFSEQQKNILVQCAVNAGMKVKEVITEPFASLFCKEIYDNCIKDIKEEKYSIIFDFGGSTLDICMVRITPSENGMEVSLRSSVGLSFGGEDISILIKEKILKGIYKLDQLAREENWTEEKIEFELMNLADSLKMELFEEEDNTEAENRLLGEDIILKKNAFDKILDEYKIKDKIYRMFQTLLESDDEGVEKEDITDIYMIGGTSKIPYFQTIVEEYFSLKLSGDMEDDKYIYHSVAFGAAKFIEYRDRINIEMSIPISVCINRGNGFEEVLKKNALYSQEGGIKKLDYLFLDKNKWKLSIYQYISFENRKEETDFVYAGYFQLEQKKYRNLEEVYISVYQNENGIWGITRQKDEKNEFITVEVLPLLFASDNVNKT